jgi:hypothetical protein
MPGYQAPGVRLGGLSQCARLYLRALYNPLGDFPHPPCIPDGVTIPSYKFATRVRGQIDIGTEGTGFLAFCPLAGVTDTGIANSDLPGSVPGTNFPTSGLYAPVITSNTAYNSVDFKPATIHDYAEHTQRFYAQSPVSVNSLQVMNNNVRQYRLVGGGVTISYVGTEIDRGGQVVLWTNTSAHPSWDDLSLAQLLLEPMSVRAKATRNAESVSYLPVLTTDLQYGTMSSWCYPDDTLEINAPRITNIIFITGAKPGSSWTFDCALHFEMLGTGIPRTQSHNDPVGYAVVSATHPTIMSTDSPERQERTALQKGLDILHTVVSHPLASKVASLVGGVAGGPAGAVGGYAVAEGAHRAIDYAGGSNYDELD